VLVDGRLRPDESGNPRVFERKDGSSGASFEVTAESVRFLDGKKDDDVDDIYSADVPF
jgi:single-strand DNA-binding protein